MENKQFKKSTSIKYCKNCEQKTQHDLINNKRICCLCYTETIKNLIIKRF